jgi:lysophospholipase L1-like esterase
MKNIFKNILFSVIIVALFFVILEMAWRVRTSYVSKDPIFLFYGRSFFELKIKSIFNKVYNMTHKEKIHKRGNKLIITFGGSTTACTYVKREDSWPDRLGYYLNANIINKAQAATSLEENLRKYKDYLYADKETPDFVIFYGGINNAANIVQNPGEIKLQPSFFSILNCRLMSISLLYASAKEAYFKHVKGDINKAWDLKSPDALKTIHSFKRELNNFADMANNFDTEWMLCLGPIKQDYFDKNPGVAEAFTELGHIMETAADKKNGHFVDLHRAIRGDLNSHYLDGIHLDEKGNDLIAQFLADYIKEHNILQ